MVNFHYLCQFQLGPWLAVEIPDLIQKGAVKHKQTSNDEQ